MKLTGVKSLAIPDVKVLSFSRFQDARGYFTETFRKSDFLARYDLPGLSGVEFVQCNESHSKAGVVRGLHFQWNPHMGKLVRTVAGRMVDLVLDIRRGSPTYGKAIGYDMPSAPDAASGEWIWVPPGFAHGNFFPEGSTIEYFCSGEYSQGCEAGISPLAPDIDWSLCDAGLKELFDRAAGTGLMTDKDRNAFSLGAWGKDPRSENFIYGR